MRVQDLTDSGAIDSADLLRLLADGVPPAPRSEDLLSLADLAHFLAMMVDPLAELSEQVAGRKLCNALAGHGVWAGRAPASVTVWRRFNSGPQALSREPTYLDGTRYPSDFERAFACYGLPLLHGRTLADIPEAEASGQPNPRYLSVVRADAMKAFGIRPAAAPAHVPLHLVAITAPTGPNRAARIAAAAAAIQQPDRNDKGQVSWSSPSTCRRFVQACEALSNAGSKTDEALQLIAEKWRCGKGASLRKRITSCKAKLTDHEVERQSAAG